MTKPESYPVLRRVFCIVMAPIYVLAIVGDNYGRALLNGTKQSFTELVDAMEELAAIWRGDRDAE